MQQSYYQNKYIKSEYSSPLFLQSINHQLRTLRSKEQILEQQLVKLSDHTKSIKKQTKRMLDSIKQQIKQKIKQKVISIEEVLKILDTKIQFVIDNCQKYSQRIIKLMNSKNKDQQTNNTQILNKISYLHEKMKMLEQKIQLNKKQQQQMKSKIEFLKQKNINLSEEYNVLSIQSAQKINDLQSQLKHKIQQIKQKNQQIKKKQVELSQSNKLAVNTTMNNSSNTFLIKNNSVNQISFIPKTQQSGATFNPNINNNSNVIYYQHPSINSKLNNTNNNLQNSNNTYKSKDSVIKQSNVSNYSNSIEIKPQFFTGNLIQSNIKEQPNPQGKGIYIRSLTKQNTGIKVKKLKQSTQSIDQRKISKDETHRFDYLLNNLAATQIQSTQIFEDSSASVGSREQYMYQTPR